MLGWQLQRFSASGAQAMLETIITMALSFVVFTFGSLLVAIQVASGQLTPRIIATTLLRDNVVRYTVGLFVFTLLFAISVLNRVEGTSHQLVLFVAGLLGLLSIAAFLYLIDCAARLLRPVSILSRVGEDGLAVTRLFILNRHKVHRCRTSSLRLPRRLPGSFIIQVVPQSSCR
jgi:uncharacterized membrane protein